MPDRSENSSVLLPTLDYPPQRGGVARYLSAIKKTFPDDVEILYWNTPLPRREMFKEILHWSRDHQQLWVSHILPIGTMAFFGKMRTRTPYVVFLHGMDFDLARRNIWKKFLTKRILKSARRIVTNSDALADEVQRFVSVKKPIVVHPAIADQFLTVGKDYKVVDKQRQPGRPIRLLTVSRLVERKGHGKVLEAIRDLPEVEYWIIGDGSYRHRIELRVKDLGLQHRVRLLGDVSDDELVKQYKAADIFVMPTTQTRIDREGFGIVYLEAQLFGLPIVGSNLPGIDEAVKNHVTGFLVNDIPTLRSAIRKLVEDPALRLKMGQAGHERVLEEFTRKKQYEKLRELL